MHIECRNVYKIAPKCPLPTTAWAWTVSLGLKIGKNFSAVNHTAN